MKVENIFERSCQFCLCTPLEHRLKFRFKRVTYESKSGFMRRNRIQLVYRLPTPNTTIDRKIIKDLLSSKTYTIC